MARWEGLKLPYHMRLTEILPLRRGPLWYWNCNCCWSSFSLRILAAAAPKWSAETMNKRFKRTLEDAREAIAIDDFV